ncbi:MAG: helix-turn-helix transcriptional regulator [Lachnospiraceae bacterium]|nr:helix-turn-helix transcriptional regulator [Lachnospiraceae bacterium]
MSKFMSEEKRKHSSQIVPFSYYECLIPDYFASVPLHWHTEFEINYIRSGCSEFICGDEKFVAVAGDVILLPPNMLHAIYPYQNNTQSYDTLVFHPAMLGLEENDRCAAECIRPIVNGSLGLRMHIGKETTRYEVIKGLVEEIFFCAKENSAQADMLLKSDLLRLFWMLEQTGAVYRLREEDANRSELIRPALEFINENFCESITVEKLAEITHLSKSYFMDRFKQAAGVGAVEYLIQLRIKKACELLVNTEKTTAEIAFECGFRNLSNYNRQFKRIVGCTPNEYRRTFCYKS